MNLLGYMEEAMSTLTDSEAKVARVILERPTAIEDFTITRLAKEAGTSTSAVQRLCQTLGFNGYKDFRYELAAQDRAMVAADKGSTDLLSESVAAIAQATALLDQLDRSQLERLADGICQAPLVLCSGIYYSSLPARLLGMRLQDLGVPAISAHDVAAATHLSNLTRGDVCLIHFSVAGSSIPQTMGKTEAAELPPHTWLVTANARHTATLPKDNVIVLPSVPTSHSHSFAEHVIMASFVELLALLVSERLEARSQAGLN